MNFSVIIPFSRQSVTVEGNGRDKYITREIKDLSAKVECSLDFKCLDVDIERILKVKDVKSEICLHCLKENATDCPFENMIGDKQCCGCSVRLKIARRLNSLQ